jgi:signal transduction histidine kinase
MLVEHHGARTALWVALRKDEAVKGIIILFRREARAFSDKEIALVQTFAEQAVIAMENARLLVELQERTAALAARNNDFGEQIAHQSATIDVLKAMSTSAADPQPIFELIVHRAWLLCDCRAAALFEYDGRLLYQRARSGFGDPAKKDAFARLFPMPAETDTVAGRVILSRQIVNIADAHDDLALHAAVRDLHAGSLLGVPMLRDGRPVGAIAMNARTTGGFSDSQIELLKTFAEQAVIAIGSAETYRELQERTAALAARNSEFGERIGQQSATIDVLKAMSASANDTQPVFDLITRRARELCGTAASMLFEFDGDLLHLRSWGGWDPAAAEGYLKQFPMRPDCSTANGRAILERRIIHIRDVARDTALGPTVRAMGVGSTIAVPLMRNDRPLGSIALGLPVSGGFSENQVELLQTFAEQAVIAIGSVATFNELQARTAALARSVDELQALETVLRAVNSSLDIDTVLDTIISRAVQLSQADEGTIYEIDQHQEVFVPKSAVGMSAERVEALRERRIRIGETPLGQSAAMRAPLHIPDLTMTPDDTGLVAAGIHAVLAVPLLREDTLVGGLVIRRRSAGGFGATIPTLLQTFAGQAVLAIENAGLFREARRARAEAETTLADLRRTQDRLVQTEKMASLGQLTAGIAHEIKNPLNFVNNFSDLSTDLLDELNAALTPEKLDMAADLRAEIDDLTAMLKGNLQRIAEHGRRADSIVKNMLLHSRAGSGERRPVDVNSTAEEALNLAYHGARAETPGFNITLEKDLDPGAGQSEMFPQEIVRVLVNLIGNGFYAARKRAERTGTAGFEPTLRLATRDLGTHVEIRVRDNGTGIPDTVRERIFEPFFTTKPAGEGTGLGLSLSYDIVVKQHGGQLTVDSRPDAFTEFVITLPRRARAGAAA